MRMYKSPMVAVFLLISLATGFYYMVFGFDHFFEPDVVAINLEAGTEIEFNLVVTKACTHENGMGFIDENDDPGKFPTIFGEKVTALNLPAKMGISITDENSETVFERKDFGGKKLGFRYAVTHIKFIAGKARLLPGAYRVKINAYEIDEDLTPVTSYFFATHIPKTRCGK